MVSPDLLADIPFFCDLASEEREMLAPIAREASFGAGERVFDEGSPSRKLRVLKSGLISLRMAQDDEQEAQMMTISEPGQIFGISALLGEKGVHPYGALCLEESVLVELDAKEMFNLFERKPAAGYRMLRNLTGILGERLAGAREQIRTRVVPGIISHG